ncbi:hypothetical protein HXX76_000129 [Chlamydomonas incerta]|uniref:Uncharacterized protein n=1 Tax=Chlamydomonas incerta TaxID=51695 RepID=A0A835WDS2_CHLIN|nr:hypothetical protein HXX76_000129 [Chlamydomonas incerta]|eukprot:KAG2445513.1 hypothetical protein HXX76_000129 [Chlamydomonas incerta]
MRNLEGLRAVEEARGAALAKILGMEVKNNPNPADVLRDARENASKTRKMASELQMGFTEYCLNQRSEVREQYGPPRDAHEPPRWSDSEEDDVAVDEEGEPSSAHACNTRVSANTLHTDAAASTRDPSPHQLTSFHDLEGAASPAASRAHSAAYSRRGLLSTAPDSLIQTTAATAAAASGAKGSSGGIPLAAAAGAHLADRPWRGSSFTMSPSAGASMRRRSIHLEFLGEDSEFGVSDESAITHRRPNRSSIGEDPRTFVSAEHARCRVVVGAASAAAGGDGAAPMWVQRAAGLVSGPPAAAICMAAGAASGGGDVGAGGGGGRFTRGRLLHLVVNNAGPAAVAAAAVGIMPSADDADADDTDGYAAAAAAGVLAAPPPPIGKAASFLSGSTRRRSIDAFPSPSGGSGDSPAAAALPSPSGSSFTAGGAPLRPTHHATSAASARAGSLRPASHGFAAVSPSGSSAAAAAAARALMQPPPAGPAPGAGGGALHSRPVVCRTQSSTARCGHPAAAPSWEEPKSPGGVGGGATAAAGGDTQSVHRNLLQNRHLSMRQRDGVVASGGSCGAAVAGGMPEWRAAATGSAGAVAAAAAMHQPRPPSQPIQHRSFRRGSIDEQWLASQRGALHGAAAAAVGVVGGATAASRGGPPSGAAAPAGAASAAASTGAAAAAAARGMYMRGRGSVDHADIQPAVVSEEDSRSTPSGSSRQESGGLEPADRFGDGSVMARLFAKWNSLRRSDATLHD